MRVAGPFVTTSNDVGGDLELRYFRLIVVHHLGPWGSSTILIASRVATTALMRLHQDVSIELALSVDSTLDFSHVAARAKRRLLITIIVHPVRCGLRRVVAHIHILLGFTCAVRELRCSIDLTSL